MSHAIEGGRFIEFNPRFHDLKGNIKRAVRATALASTIIGVSTIPSFSQRSEAGFYDSGVNRSTGAAALDTELSAIPGKDVPWRELLSGAGIIEDKPDLPAGVYQVNSQSELNVIWKHIVFTNNWEAPALEPNHNVLVYTLGKKFGDTNILRAASVVEKDNKIIVNLEKLTHMAGCDIQPVENNPVIAIDIENPKKLPISVSLVENAQLTRIFEVRAVTQNADGPKAYTQGVYTENPTACK